MKKGILGTLILVGMALVLTLSTAYASIIIDFSDHGLQGGEIAFSGGNVIGTNIPIGQMTVTGGTLHDGVYGLTGGFLNFNTNVGSISVAGNVTSPSVTTGEPLLSGTITSFTIDLDNQGNQIGIHASGPDAKDSSLLSYLGIPSDFAWDYFGFSLTNGTPTDDGFQAGSTDIRNSAIPEPATMLLLGSGLVGMGVYARRRFKK